MQSLQSFAFRFIFLLVAVAARPQFVPFAGFPELGHQPLSEGRRLSPTEAPRRFLRDAEADHPVSVGERGILFESQPM
jgi:hypothetical protein